MYYPSVSLSDNKDKIITQGNSKKQSVSFILEYDKNIIDYFTKNNIDASVLVDMNTFDNTLKLEQLNNEVNNLRT